MLDRQICQILVEKLDLNQMTPKEAKDILRNTYRKEIIGRTREQVIRQICQLMKYC